MNKTKSLLTILAGIGQWPIGGWAQSRTVWNGIFLSVQAILWLRACVQRWLYVFSVCVWFCGCKCKITPNTHSENTFDLILHFFKMLGGWLYMESCAFPRHSLPCPHRWPWKTDSFQNKLQFLPLGDAGPRGSGEAQGKMERDGGQGEAENCAGDTDALVGVGT